MKIHLTNPLKKAIYGLKYGLKIIFSVFLFVLILSITIYVATFRFSWLINILAASPRTPWGIITSLFVHGNERHLVENMIPLFFFLVFLVVTNMFLSEEEIKRRVLFSLPLIFSIPIMLNFLWIKLGPDVGVIGSSGIGYALEGICMGFALINSLELRRINKCAQNQRKTLLVFPFINIIFFIGLLFYLVFSPSAFFSVGPRTNILIHYWAFYAGFLTVLLYMIPELFKKDRIKKWLFFLEKKK